MAPTSLGPTTEPRGGRPRRTIDRALEERFSTAAVEMTELVDAAFAVIAESESLDPPVRDIIAAAGSSTQVFYRHFRSKDELMLIVHDEGVRMLAAYLEHRMSRESDPLGRIREWIEGVLRQAEDPGSSRRTRPFAVGSSQLLSRFPEEQRQQEAVLVGMLETEIAAAAANGRCASPDPGRDALVIHEYTFGLLRRHFVQRTAPTAETRDHLLDYTMRALRAGPATPDDPAT
jgi:AcrR family transcriptional regulator